MLLSPDGDSVFICTNTKIRLLALTDNTVREEVEFPLSFWATHPTDRSLLVAFQANILHLFDWCSLKRVSIEGGIPITSIHVPPDTRSSIFDVAWIGGVSSAHAVFCVHSLQQSIAGLAALEASNITPETKELAAQALTLDTVHVRDVVGIYRSTLYFTDTTGWMCSLGLKSLYRATHYTRHFFIAPTWYIGEKPVIKVLSKTAVAFARGEHMIVLHGFLDFEEKVPLEGGTLLSQ